MNKWLFIAAGGSVGSLLRYLVSGWAQAWGNQIFPYGTLIVNLAGCLLMGFCASTLLGVYAIREEYRAGIMIGVLGGFTTFSAFGWETFSMINEREFFNAGLNIAGNNILGLGAVWLGYRLGLAAFGV